MNSQTVIMQLFHFVLLNLYWGQLWKCYGAPVEPEEHIDNFTSPVVQIKHQNHSAIVSVMNGLSPVQNLSALLAATSYEPDHAVYNWRETLLLNAKVYQDVGHCAGALSAKEVHDIQGYKEVAHNITDYIINSFFKGETYKELKSFVQFHPFRPAGNEFLETAIDYIVSVMKRRGIENVHTEPIKIRPWYSKKHTAKLVEPFSKDIRILPFEHSKTTVSEGFTADVLVVKSFEELDRRHSEAHGKIVVYNQGFLGLEEHTNVYRIHGASHAAQYGAVAALIETTTYPSIENPQNSPMKYWANVTAIPCAAIGMEDANLLYKLQANKEWIQMHLHIEELVTPANNSKNVIGELSGIHAKKEFVGLVSHSDCSSKDGGASDASGVFIPLMALAALQSLKLRPHRTIEFLMFTGSEVGLHGSYSYVHEHKGYMNAYSAVIQADGGAYKARGMDFAGHEKAACIVREILKLNDMIAATSFARFPTVSSDIANFIAEGVPGMSVMSDDAMRSRRYHNGAEDGLSALDSDDLDDAVALIAVTSYVLADLGYRLPRGGPE